MVVQSSLGLSADLAPGSQEETLCLFQLDF